jgi:cytochrome c oxidase subunit 3
MAAHAAAEHDHHGPPTANASSRVDARTLGMLMFIGSEIMLFGSFFTPTFVPRRQQPAASRRRASIARLRRGPNTAIPVTSSFRCTGR